jgi:hypothetical protein
VVSDDGFTGKSYYVTVNQIAAPKVLSFNVDDNQGTINNLDHTITVLVQPSYDITNIIPTITLPEGQTIVPESNLSQDFSAGPVTYSVTNTEGLIQDYTVTVKISNTGVAFIGDGSSIDSLTDDDAKAAALYLKAQYPNDFKYIPFSDIAYESLEGNNAILHDSITKCWLFCYSRECVDNAAF